MRRKHETVSGQPISCWDDGPNESTDRYTVVFLGESDDKGQVPYLAMSGDPYWPQGVCLHGMMPAARVQYRGRGGAFRRRIRFDTLPADCQRAVRQDLGA